MDPARLTDSAWSEPLGDALEAAELSVETYYAISPREWASRFRYDLASCHDHPELHFRESAMAQIVRAERSGAARTRYRIVLREPTIFRLAESHDLATVLTTALTHELVHLVRFGQGLAPFEAGEHERSEEEQLVIRISEQAILTRSKGVRAQRFRHFFAEHPFTGVAES